MEVQGTLSSSNDEYNIGGNLFDTTKLFLQTITQSRTSEMATAHNLEEKFKKISQWLMKD